MSDGHKKRRATSPHDHDPRHHGQDDLLIHLDAGLDYIGIGGESKEDL